MKLRNILLILCFTLPANVIFCQETSSINTDRPDQSDGVFTLGRNKLQLETGILYGKVDESDYVLHDIMLRYGLFNGTELRVEVDYGNYFGLKGVMPATFSIKQRIISGHGIIPAITAIGYVTVPFLSTENFRPDKVPVALTMAFENPITEQFTLSYNLGIFTDGGNDELNWIITANLGYSPLDQVSFFAEYYTTIVPGFKSVGNMDFGVAWLVKQNLNLISLQALVYPIFSMRSGSAQ